MEEEKLARSTADIVRDHGFSFRKSYGQNFLKDPSVLERIIEAADITKEDAVLEIGPGIGTLTKYLAGRAEKVVTVEIDRELIPILRETLAEEDNVTVINADILKTDIMALLKEHAAGMSVKVVANLPYYITTPILLALVEQDLPVRSITVMVQKEVAQRISAGPGGKDYGALSLAVGYRARAKICFVVPPEAFVPRPHVDSAVVNLEKYEEKPVCPADERLMFEVIRAAFMQRRKTLKNAVSAAGLLGLSKAEVGEILALCGHDENVRGERLSLAEFAALSDAMLGFAGEKNDR